MLSNGQKDKKGGVYMLKKSLRFRAIVVVVLVMAMAFSCQEAFADGRGGRGGGPGGGGYHGGGGRDRHFYRNGGWYRHGWLGFDIAVTALAIGVLIESLPPRCETIVVAGNPYYYYGNYYYRPYPYGGYVVVPPPVMAPVIVQQSVEPPVVVAPAPAYQAPAVPSTSSAAAQQSSFTVNVPSPGGYTSVTLKRSGIGFIGPQGEYYADFPSIEQLQVMYGGKKK
jgi:hypothetical protein